MPKKPEELSRYEMHKDLRIPRRAGGLDDQPHIWVMEMRVVQDVIDQYDAFQKLAWTSSDASSNRS